MPRPSVGETAMTSAERQARYRAARGCRAGFRIRRPADRRSGSSAGMTPSPRPWNCRPSMPDGWRRCRTTNRTVRSPTLRAIVELDLSELQAIEPPRGFGRD